MNLNIKESNDEKFKSIRRDCLSGEWNILSDDQNYFQLYHKDDEGIELLFYQRGDDDVQKIYLMNYEIESLHKVVRR